MENGFPYPIHLCQPDGEKSCGACCGLYNWKDHSRAALEKLLRNRTSPISPPVNPESPPQSAPPPGYVKLLDDIYNCEFLGFVDAGRKRVGCLLHPAVNGGKDLRDSSFYGVELCAGHFCPGYTYLTAVEQEAVVSSLQDWYLYGLVITDIDLVKEFFRYAQDRLGGPVHPAHLKDPGVRGALRNFFRLKEFWRFTSREPRLGKYYFSRAEYQIARIEYEKNWGVRTSRFDKILVSLSSEFSSKEDVEEAEVVIETRVAAFVRACLAAVRQRKVS